MNDFTKFSRRGSKLLKFESLAILIITLFLIIFFSYIFFTSSDNNQLIFEIFAMILASLFVVTFATMGIKGFLQSKKGKVKTSTLDMAHSKLEQFKKLKISKTEINDVMTNLLEEYFYNNPVEISEQELKDILIKFKYGNISRLEILDWAHTIWFSDFYYFSKTVEEVFRDLENVFQGQLKLTEEKINSYIKQLELQKRR